MSKRLLNSLAAAALLISMLCLAANFFFGNTMQNTPGALSLGVVSDTLWIADLDNIVVASTKGKELRRFALKSLGLSRPPSAILSIAPDRVLLIERFSDTLVEIDPVSGQRQRSFSLQWPQDFSGDDLIVTAANTPVDSTGHYDLAVATGGMHAVLLFDSEGHFKARSKKGTYNFTNGIWYSPDGWWTTDTNRFFLRRVKLDSLEELASIQLNSSGSGQIYLGLAARYPSTNQDSSSSTFALPSSQPLATLFRHQDGMSIGRVVDVYPDGSEEVYPLSEDAKLVDLAWFGGQLVVIEGQEQRLRSFSSARIAQDDFGDSSLNRYYSQIREKHVQAALINRGALIGAVVCMLLGILLALLAKQRSEKEPQGLEPEINLNSDEAEQGADEEILGYGSPALQWISSALIPGLGQWMQRRNGVALMFFLPFALWTTFVLTPLVWTALGHRAEIPSFAFPAAFTVWFLLALVAAIEAWHATTEE